MENSQGDSSFDSDATQSPETIQILELSGKVEDLIEDKYRFTQQLATYFNQQRKHLVRHRKSMEADLKKVIKDKDEEISKLKSENDLLKEKLKSLKKKKCKTCKIKNNATNFYRFCLDSLQTLKPHIAEKHLSKYEKNSNHSEDILNKDMSLNEIFVSYMDTHDVSSDSSSNSENETDEKQ